MKIKTARVFLVILVLSVCTTTAVNALDSSIYDIFQEAIKKKMNDYLLNNDPSNQGKMQLKFIQQFIKGIILGEIKLYDWALHQTNSLSNKEIVEIKNEVNGLVELLFNERYSSLQQLINEIKKENPKTLQNIFSEETFNEDILKPENQEKLVNAILNKLFESKNSSENLVAAFQDLEQLKKFLVKYKGVSESDIERSIEYLKDVKKIKKSLDGFVDKLSNPEVRDKLVTLAYKMASGESLDLFEVVSSEPILIELLLDQDWETLMKIKESIYSIGGKAYKDYQNKRIQEEEALKNKQKEEEEKNEDQDDEEDEDEKKSTSLSFGQVILIIASISFVIGLVFIGVRKYRQTKFGNESFSDSKQFYQQQL